jgi:PAS domain S-box-containing protein
MAREGILVVEDEVIVGMEIESRLRKLGYRVVGPVRTGEEALEAVRRDDPTLVLMDVMLAGELDGIETAGQISRDFGLPVVYLTAFADDATLQRARDSDPYGYLVKPFEERELYTAIEIALHKHRLVRRLQERELRYRSLFACAGDAMLLLEAAGPDAGRIVDANRAAAGLYGYGEEELRAMGIGDLDAGGEAAAGLLERLFAGERIRGGLRRRKDGTLLAVESSAGLCAFAEQRYVLVIDRAAPPRVGAAPLVAP